MRILVTGASGLIGKNFIRLALQEGHHIHALVRNPDSFKMLPPQQVFQWRHDSFVPAQALAEIDAVIHLAGEGVADKHWSKEQKKRLVDSRILGTRNLVASLEKLPRDKRPQTLISGSAIGFYGYQKEGLLDENSRAGDDFLSRLCVDWEKEAQAAKDLGLRVVLLRTGIVLSKEGGALAKMPPVQISDGQDWMSWIHVKDMCQILLFALKNKALSGPINCVAPSPVQNKEFVQELARAKNIPTFGFIPKTLLRIALGEMSNAVLSSLKIRSKVLTVAGFEFRYPTLRSALESEFRGTGAFDSFLFKDQFVPLKPEEVFGFFSRAENLEVLTPPWLKFKIISKSTDEVKKGTLIDYKLKIHGCPVYWKTLIEEWRENEFFVDRQLKGPYSKWHHLHTFEAVPGGCLVRDQVTYRVPVAVLGNFLLGRWISSDVSQIFKFRQQKIQDLVSRGELSWRL